MKPNHLIFLILLLLLRPFYIVAQIEEMVVEKYYISDINDATDTDGGFLENRSVTYRVYVKLAPGFQVKKMYGNSLHPLQFSSTESFFNNTDRGNKFGFRIGSNRISDNTTALDTWLTIGYATNKHFGIQKPMDTDGSMVGGTNNDGGSESVSGGLLINQDPLAGIPLTNSDGLVQTDIIPQFLDFGINDTSIFGPTFKKSFSGTNVYLLSYTSVPSPNDSNFVLLAQLTTKGEIAFKINLEVEKEDGTMLKIVADDQNLLPDERSSKWLSYPFISGCTDPNFAEFNPLAVTDDGSCSKPIILGCMDQQACNYDPLANFNVKELCCYGPESCDNRNIEIVCPGYHESKKASLVENDTRFTIYPNPTNDFLNLTIDSGPNEDVSIEIYSALGKKVISRHLSDVQPYQSIEIDMRTLEKGIYLFQLIISNKNQFTERFILK